MNDKTARSDGPRIHIASLGCAKNLIDSERLLARLAGAGAIVGASPEEAEIIIVNTCGFIAPAKQESIETILELARYKEADPSKRLIIMGCLAQRYGPELREGIPEADAVFGLNQEDAIVAACGLDPHPEDGRLLLTPPHTAYLRISEGCNNKCTYCTIPMIRGPYRSRPPEEIIAEAKELMDSGVKELVVIAQDTTLYGTDLPGDIRIHDLINRLAELKALHWIRLLYTHPAHFPDGLVDAYRENPKLAPYVDLPLQHLNDDILRRMGRGVTQEAVLDLIARLRARVPGIAIRTTFIVGFPGETRARFNELLRLVRELRFEHLGAFPYSREEGTPAAVMSGQVSEKAKSRRVRDLMLAQQEIVFSRNQARIGERVEVVIDGRLDDDTWIGRTAAQAPDVDPVTYVSGIDLEPGKFIEIEITGTDGYDLIARPVLEKGGIDE